MARAHAKVLMETVDKKTYKCDQIIEASGIWAVFFDNKPINLKSSQYQNPDSIPTYKKTSFSNPGHAKNLCKKLNAQFKTDRFTVTELTMISKIHNDHQAITETDHNKSSN